MFFKQYLAQSHQIAQGPILLHTTHPRAGNTAWRTARAQLPTVSESVIPPCTGTASEAAASLEQVLNRDCSLPALSRLANPEGQHSTSLRACQSPPLTLEKSFHPLGNSSKKAKKKAPSPSKHTEMKSQTLRLMTGTHT